MGMFSLPKPFFEHIELGQEFTLSAARVETIPTRDYGPTDAVIMTIGNEEYSAFGQGLVAQVNRMAPDDLPARVTIQEGPAKTPGHTLRLFVPAGKQFGDVQSATPTPEETAF